MRVRVRERKPRRRYECFDCGLEISVRATLHVCPNCEHANDWHQMD